MAVPPGLAQPTILSTVPNNMATGVSPTAPVVIVFSEAMNPTATTAQFMDAAVFPPVFLPSTPTWSAANTILTCTPSPAWSANKMIVWFVEGENPSGDSLDGETGGVFTTGSSGGGDCTNTIGSLTLGKGSLYRQTSTGAPTLDADAPFVFVGCGTVACSNSTTTNISLTVPGGAVVNLPAVASLPGHYSLTDVAANLSALDGEYPNGNYLFTLKSPAGNSACTVNFLASLVMPNAPHLTNFAAAQSIDPTKPFVLGWDAFQGGTATDCIFVEIYGGVFQTPALGALGALPGTARSVTIPAGTLQPKQTYEGAVTFYDLVLGTNACDYVNLVYRAAITEFSLTTGSDAPALALTPGTANRLVVSWPAPADNWFLERTNALPSVAVASWPRVALPYQTNAGKISVTVTNSPATGSQFFRLHKP